MEKRTVTRSRLLDRWRAIEEDDSKGFHIGEVKEQWFSDTINFLLSMSDKIHIWCGCRDLMGPLLEAFHGYFNHHSVDPRLKTLWKRVSHELGQCTQCICQHHQAQEMYNAEYESNSVLPLLTVLRRLDEDRMTDHLKEINAKIATKETDLEGQNAEIVSIMFEVLMFPLLLDCQPLVDEFQIFIEAIDKSHELTLAGHQQYPGVYALLFFKNTRVRSIGLRLAGYMGKLRNSADLEPLQPLLKKYIGILEAETTSETSHIKVQLERMTVWLGVKALLSFLEPDAFEEGILERYPIFLSIVLNHVSDDTPEFSYAVTCLRFLYEMLGYKLWLRTSLSPSMMRNTLLGQCFHTRNEKSHKEIFDLFQPFLQSLESLQDGEHEKQRRHFLYFLLHQVNQSSNFSFLIRKKACQVAFNIVHRGYKMNPPCPPAECAHMWGPSLICSLKDSSLHHSLRQPAFDLIQTIIIADASALASIYLKQQTLVSSGKKVSLQIGDDEDILPSLHDTEEMEICCWAEFTAQNKMISWECKEWICVPVLWLEVLTEIDHAVLPLSFFKAVLWSLSRFPVIEPSSSSELAVSTRQWLSSNVGKIADAFAWCIPSGCDDDSGEHNSKNSVRASDLCIPLIRIFKRFAAHFINHIEEGERWKQWAWEPMMAESLILLLLDANDNVRQVDRLILEHVSKTRGLTAGLQFLCSTTSSLTAVYLGLRCCLSQVQHTILSNFRNLHHLLFIVRKLLKDVSDQSNSNISLPAPNSSKFLSEGGFLRQPNNDPSLNSTPKPSFDIVQMKSWRKISSLMSLIMWPFVLQILVEGKALIDEKSSQMTCVRLLELIPILFERIKSSSFEPAVDFKGMMEDDFSFKWFCDLIDWGKSTLIVVSRHWKQAVLSLLDLLKDVCNMDSLDIIKSIETDIQSESSAISQLKEKISLLRTIRVDKSYNEKSSLSGVVSIFRENIRLEQPILLEDDCDDVKILEMGFPKRQVVNEPIVVSDDGAEALKSRDLSEKKPGLELQNLMDKQAETNPVNIDTFSSCQQAFSSSQISHILHKKDEPLQDTSTSSWEHGIENFRKRPLSQNKPVLLHENREDNGIPSRNLNRTGSTRIRGSSLEIEEKDFILKGLVSELKGDPWEQALKSAKHPPSPMTNTSVTFPKRRVIQLNMPSEAKPRYHYKMDDRVKRLKPPKLDDWYRSILEIDYFSTVGLSSANEDEIVLNNLKEVPVSFESPAHYVEIFRPLVLEEFKAQLQNSFLELSSSEEIPCNKLCVLSVERIDDFHIIRCLPDDSESGASRIFSDNDLVLFTKQPLQNSTHNVHIVGKVERREKDEKHRLNVLVIRFYLQKSSSRLNKATRLLTERSKWHASRILSITPHLREFQALSSLKDIPILPVILNPTQWMNDTKSKVDELSKLPQALQQLLKSSFNDSQLQAINTAIGNSHSKKTFDLSLIQGPPGTGKTRTIVAIVSGLLALDSLHKNNVSEISDNNSRSGNDGSTNFQPSISQSAAIARAWQDAAFAKQLMKESEKESRKQVDKFRRPRILICAQSNAAVDELVSRIMCEGLYGCDGKRYKPYLVRVGNAKTVHPDSLPFFIDSLVEQRLAEEKCDNDLKHDLGSDSIVALRSKLEKLVDNIRFFEAKRANLRRSDSILKSSTEQVSSAEDNVDEISEVEIKAKLNTLYGEKRSISIELAASHAREKKISEDSRVLKNKMRKTILREAEIVITTLSGCGGVVYGVCSESLPTKFGTLSEQSLFDAVVVDEAAQALEPATLIPLQLLKSVGTRCIMVGDPKQLPATVLSNLASKFLYECSMFERLQRAGHPVIMLTEQYRMHPEISLFPSLHFYDNKLLNGRNMSEKLAPFHENPYLRPYLFFDIVDGLEQHGTNSGSLSHYNEGEADACVELLGFFKKRYPSEFFRGRIGIITPYRSQLSLLRSRFAATFGSSVASDIEFNTVDGFQGREVDVMILSTVRASDPSVESSHSSDAKSNTIGFVSDMRRMNVALTRPKFSLWILGHTRTLQSNLHWGALIKNAKERNLVVSVAKPFKSAFDRSLPSLRRKIESISLAERDIPIQDMNREITRKKENMGRTFFKRTKESASSRIESISDVQMDRETFLNRKSSKISKELRKLSNDNSRDLNQRSLCHSSTKGDKHKDPSSESPPKDLIATRKRQREAIDALLSSALISSKKANSTLKSSLEKNPSSPPMDVDLPKKQPKLTKALRASSSHTHYKSTISTANAVDHPNSSIEHSSSGRNLSKERTTSKDLVRDQ